MSQKYVVGSRDWPSPQGILLCTALRTGETLRADEIVIEVADGRPIRHVPASSTEAVGSLRV